MRLLNHHCALQKPTLALWLLVCACFVFASVAMPAYSAQKMLPNISMSKAKLADNMGTSGASQHGTMSQHHHVEIGGSSSLCHDSGCDAKAAECTDSCTMATCCSSPGVSNTLFSRVHTNHHGESFYRLADASTVISRRSEPLFRPPIL